MANRLANAEISVLFSSSISKSTVVTLGLHDFVCLLLSFKSLEQKFKLCWPRTDSEKLIWRLRMWREKAASVGTIFWKMTKALSASCWDKTWSLSDNVTSRSPLESAAWTVSIRVSPEVPALALGSLPLVSTLHFGFPTLKDPSWICRRSARGSDSRPPTCLKLSESVGTGRNPKLCSILRTLHKSFLASSSKANFTSLIVHKGFCQKESCAEQLLGAPDAFTLDLSHAQAKQAHRLDSAGIKSRQQGALTVNTLGRRHQVPNGMNTQHITPLCRCKTNPWNFLNGQGIWQ